MNEMADLISSPSTSPQHSRQKSDRLLTTTPSTTIGLALKTMVAPSIPQKFFDGLPILKISSKGTIVPRILTISDDLFTIFVSHDKFTDNKEGLGARIQYRGYKVYSRMVKTVVGHHSSPALKDIRVIDVADVLFVQSGFCGSRKVEGCKAKFDSRKVVSIFHNDVRTIDFLINSEEDRNELLRIIAKIRECYHSEKKRLGRERRLLRYIWYDTDWDKSGMIGKSEFLHLLSRINVYIKKELANKMFNDAVVENNHSPCASPSSRYPEISFNQCINILRKIKQELFNGNEVRDAIFDRVFGPGKEEVTVVEFLEEFLHNTQKEYDATIEDVRRVFGELNCMEILRADDGEDAYRFTIDRSLFDEYLTSAQNDLFDLTKKTVDPFSLDEPLSHYWINTSHNTYLTGDQLKSTSSVEMYVLALQRGCKCLELDCWDDTFAQIPVVYHGYTLTSKIPFQHIITAVKFYIESNPLSLPIILSLENHCSPMYQRTMALILNTTLENMLYVPNHCQVLPSPSALVGKVVIKGKRPPEEKEDIEAMPRSITSKDGNIDIDESIEQQLAPVTDEALARLTLLNGVSFEDFHLSMLHPLTDMHSFSESKIAKILKSPENKSSWRYYNRDHMSRTYPSGSRVDSSNGNPLIAWAIGCQLVALNFQTNDSAMVINDGRFRENGGCGYVRKPPGLLFDTNESPVLGEEIMLRIRVLSGTCLPKPEAEKVGDIIDPYVVIRVNDVDLGSSDPKTGSLRLDLAERKTNAVTDNGHFPQWNSDVFTFSVKSPDVAVVSFYVIDSDGGFMDDMMCKVAVPVSCLRKGFRSIQFYDQCNSQYGPFEFASILVEVDVQPVLQKDRRN